MLDLREIGVGIGIVNQRVAALPMECRATLAEYPDTAQTVLVGMIGAGPRALERRDAVLEAFAEALYRDNARHAPGYGVPTFASHDDAFAVIGAIVELVSRQLRADRPEDPDDLEPVITRLLLGVLDRAGAA